MSLLETRLAWGRLLRTDRRPGLKVALLATYTAAPLVPYSGMALEAAGMPADLWVGPFDQIAMQCLDDASETASYRPDVLVVHARLEELWAGLPVPLDGATTPYLTGALELVQVATAAARRWGATLVMVLPALPEARPLGVGDAGHPQGVAATAAAVRQAMRRALAEVPGALVADMEDVVRAIGTEAAMAPSLFATAKIPYSEAAFDRLGRQLARLVTLSRRSARKVLVVDADHTLWGGVVGEDGPQGLVLGGTGAGAAFVAFQRFLLAQREAGVLLALASKNEEADVWAAFERPEMVLKREHLAAWRINWSPKSANMAAMAEELSLGLDSFVFVDDNPAELAEVGASCPEVGVIRMPVDPARWLEAVQGSGLLDRLPPTTEDRARAVRYTEARARVAAAEALSPEAYLSSLNLVARVFSPGASDLPRLAQLVAKTNQFNLTCRRRDAAALEVLMGADDHLVRLVEARDRFGDYGVIGAAILVRAADGAHIDSFLLSCRAMGRGLERAMVADLQAEADRRGWGPILATLEEHPRNAPARTFFESLGAGPEPRVLAPCAWPTHITQPTEVAT